MLLQQPNDLGLATDSPIARPVYPCWFGQIWRIQNDSSGGVEPTRGATTEAFARPVGRFQREFPDHVAMLRELRGAGLVKTEGGGQPNATPRTRHDDSSPLRHQPRRPAGRRCERADLDDLQSAARRDRSAAGRDERPDE